MKVFPFLLLLFTVGLRAQVGVGTTSPKSSLDIPASNLAAPTNQDGLLIPRVSAFPVTNPTLDQNGMMVFLTVDLPGKPKGFYYWDNPTTAWIGVGADAKGWELQGNAGTNPSVNFFGTSDDNDIVFKRNSVRAGLISTGNTSFGNSTLNPANTAPYNSAFGVLTLPANTTGEQNSVLGDGAMQFNTTGSFNSAIGSNTMNRNTSGYANCAFGAQASEMNTTGYFNSAFGNYSLRGNTGNYNSGFGGNAMRLNTTGYENVAVGVNAGYTNQSGYRNIAIGNNALYYNTSFGIVGVGHQAAAGNTTGQYNTAIGTYTLLDNQTGNYNTALGYNALIHNKNSFNTAVGVNALFSDVNGTANTASGMESLFSNTDGSLNTAQGYRSLRNNTLGAANTAMGENALGSNTTANYNVAIGGSALISNTTGSENVAVGTSALRLNDTGGSSTAVGVNAAYSNKAGYTVAVGNRALTSNTIGQQNTAIGTNALRDNVEGSYNTAVGFNALLKNNDGTPAGGGYNVAVGNYALNSNTTGSSNTAIGYISMLNNTTGTWNTAVGGSTLRANTTGFNNTVIGHNALSQNLTGAYNSTLGMNTLYTLTDGQDNTAIGYQSMLFLGSGNNNTALGAWSMQTQTAGSGNIAIGRNINLPSPTASDQLDIGHAIYGTSINNPATALVGIGGVPTEKLDVFGKTKTVNFQMTNGAAAGKVLVSDASGNASWQNAAAVDAAWYEVATVTAPDAITDNMYHTGNVAIGVNNPGTTKLYVSNTQLTANGDGQSTLFGYRSRDSQNDGTSYSLASSNRAVGGYNYFGDSYSFGVSGFCDNDYNRTGGAFGGQTSGGYWASMGYKNSGYTPYGIYATAALATGTGRNAQNLSTTGIGGGFYGGVIGSWSKGTIGNVNAGDWAASYNQGDEYTSGKQIELVHTGASKTAAYTVTSTEVIVYKKGKINLVNGTAHVTFDENYRNLLGDVPVVTATPMGPCNGVYIESIDKDGFTVRELAGGTGSATIAWIAVGDRVDAQSGAVTQIKDAAFDQKLDGALFNENEKARNADGIWIDGGQLHTGQMPAVMQPQLPKTK